VTQAVADQHRRLGQCEHARPLYQEVLRQEPDNAPAVLGLGVCAFERGDLEEAIDRFERAITLDGSDPTAPFDLSLVHFELYQFGRARDALAKSQRLSPEKVARWISRGGPPQPAAVDGGFRRVDEIRADLVRSWALEDETAEALTPWRDLMGLPLTVACMLAALVFSALAPQPRRFIGPPVRLRRRAEIARRTLLPGLAEAWEGEAFSGFVSLWIPVALLSLTLVDRFGLRVPLGLETPMGWTAWLAWSGLALFLLLRWRGVARAT
jgi:tetratricopeptide (TPR) repeat protein